MLFCSYQQLYMGKKWYQWQYRQKVQPVHFMLQQQINPPPPLHSVKHRLFMSVPGCPSHMHPSSLIRHKGASPTWFMSEIGFVFFFLYMHLPLARFCSVASFTSLPLKSRGQESTQCRCCFPSLELSLFLRLDCRHCLRTWISTSALPPGSMYVGRTHMHYLLIFLGCLLLPCFQLLFPLPVRTYWILLNRLPCLSPHTLPGHFLRHPLPPPDP